MMPLGIRCSAVLTPLITSVWPALWPPWKRTTPCDISVSQSTSLPLPSSPHWVPTTTTLRPATAACLFVIFSFWLRVLWGKQVLRLAFMRHFYGLNHPLTGNIHQFAIAAKFIDLMFVPRQHAGYCLATLAQAVDGSTQADIFGPRRANGGLQ